MNSKPNVYHVQPRRPVMPAAANDTYFSNVQRAIVLSAKGVVHG